MTRLPTPGSDAGEWGQILNDYLSTAHKPDGTLKPDVVDASVIANDAISEANLSEDVRDKLNVIAGQQGATGPSGPSGAAGPTGATGPIGPAGTGVPGAGTTGQLLAKSSNADYATEWIDAPTVAASGVVSVLVSTGSEARPTADTVLWLGGATEPVNMTNGDLWFSPTQPTDTEAPTQPTSLISSSITSSSFTLGWTGATDNIAVTAYEVFIDGVSYKIVTGTSTNITGRNGNTTYACTVRARDAAGNWGDLSDALNVTTLESVATDHSVYASSPVSALQSYNDGGTITVATGFRIDTSDWSVKGARIYVPSGATIPSSATAYLFAGATTPDLANPIRTATISTAVGQWNEVDFPTTYTATSGQYFWIGYDFGNGAYLSSSAAGTSQIQASDGALLYMAPDDIPGGAHRNYYRMNSGDTSHSTIGGQSYGIDVIVTEA